ncbi:copper resistance protein NlpE N-terminal domain-containing protein [Fodinibius sediminis]|nr:copper resistance protein NlpE N-terminal domain-containing protein [Fodinibius sediminis]
MEKIIAVLLVGVFIGACSDERRSSAPPTEIAGTTYSGIIPCADCEGILYELALHEDQHYESSSIYLGKSSRPFTETGSYAIRDDSILVLEERSGGERYFMIDDSTLVMRDRNKEKITGSLAARYILNRGDRPMAGETGQWDELREQGIDFRAAGNEPFWNLEIDFDKLMRFKALDGDAVETSAPEMKKDTASRARLLMAETGQGIWKVALYPVGCLDSMSGKYFSHRVVVTSGADTFRGCGEFINDRYRLHDFWILHSFDGEEIAHQQQPVLSFNLVDSRVQGNSGCNQLIGEIIADGEQLSLGRLVSTKMACSDSMKLETAFLDALSRTDSYKVSRGELLLLQDNDTLMVLHRAE